MINILSSLGLDPVCHYVCPYNISSVQVLKGAGQQVGDVLKKGNEEINAQGLRKEQRISWERDGL